MSDLTYDLASPRRPGVAQDLGGAALIDDPEFPPNPETDPTADTWNQMGKLLEAICRTAPVAILEVSAAAAVTNAKYMRSTAPGTTPTAVLNGAGDISVSWAAADFPAAALAPVAVVRGATVTTCATDALSPGARVRTGAAVPFTLYIY